MGKKKEAKKQAKAEKERLAKYPGTCPKCKHAAHEHRVTTSYGVFLSFYIGERPSSGKGHCNARIEKPGDDGMLRIEACNCDLTPDEAQLNATKASGLKSFDALMSSLNETQG